MAICLQPSKRNGSIASSTAQVFPRSRFSIACARRGLGLKKSIKSASRAILRGTCTRRYCLRREGLATEAQSRGEQKEEGREQEAGGRRQEVVRNACRRE